MRLVLASLALIALLAPSAAQAGRVKVSSEEPEGGLSLAGNQVVYVDYNGGQNLIRLASPGSSPRVLDTFPGSVSDDDCCATIRSVGLDSSPTRLATLFSQLDTAKGVIVDNTAKLAAGPLTGPFQAMFQCSTGGEYEAGGFDLDGDRLAFVAGGCNSGGRSVVVRDLASGAEVTNFPAPAARALWDVQLAGPYVAYSTSGNQFRPDEPRDVTVRDVAAGTDQFTVPALSAFDLQADGKLAVNTAAAAGQGCPSTLDWYSPAEPSRHATGICAVSAPHIAGDRILVERRAPGAEAADVVLTDLSGNARTLAGAASASGLGGLDFDGTRAAYVVNSCVPQKAAVYLDDLGPADPVTVGGSCPVKPLQRTLRASRTGKVALSFRCPNGCGGSVDLIRGNDELISTSPDFAGGSGIVKTTVRLTRSTRRLLDRRGRLKVSVQGVAKTLDKDGSRPFLRKVTLRAPRRSR